MKSASQLLALLLLLPLLVLQAAEKPKFPSYFPPFSWDKVPVYQMFADGQRLLTDAEVSKIAATSDFICIEKNHAYTSLGGADLGTKAEIPRFKSLRPTTKSLCYFNSAYAYAFTTYTKGFRYGKVSADDQRFLIKDAATGELAHRQKTYFFDVLNPEFRTWWAETAGQFVRESGADGLFVDQMHGFAWLRPKAKTQVAQAQAGMMRLAKQAIGPDKILLLNNGADIPELFALGDAFMFEHFDAKLLTKEAILQDWELLKKISQAGKIGVWRIGVEADHPELGKAAKNRPAADAVYETLSKERLPFYLAAFLIGAQPYSYFQYGWGWTLRSGPLAGYPEFDKPLGKPTGAYTRPDPNGWIFQREFEHASVWLDLNSREGKIEWR